MQSKRTLGAALSATLVISGCGGGDNSSSEQTTTISTEALDLRLLGPESPVAVAGKKLFDKAFPHTNGRPCSSCHVEANHFTLLPSDVQTRLAANPREPLFNPIDAEDPSAVTPTYEHLE